MAPFARQWLLERLCALGWHRPALFEYPTCQRHRGRMACKHCRVCGKAL